MAKRVLLLGSTGLTKNDVALKIKNRGNYLKREVRIEEFENTYLPKSRLFRSMDHYLAMNLYEQAKTWKDAWPLFKANQNSSADVVMLIVHGTIVDTAYGVRPSVNADLICQDFKPDLIVTLIDNIYTMWWETEQRAASDQSQAQPSLEQLLMARRVESLVADQIAVGLDSNSQQASIVLFSKNHPTVALENLVFHNAHPIYLSFPISAPRRLLADDRMRGRGIETVNAINELHTVALRYETENSILAFISPLAIDELPFVRVCDETARDEIAVTEERYFDFAPDAFCWPAKDLWPGADLLVGALPYKRPIPLDHAENVKGMIRTDVGWRDSRLAMQAESLIVFSPAMPQPDGSSKVARGVTAEIELAAKHNIPCYVYQKPEFDPDNAWKNWFGTKGSMGPNTVHSVVNEVSSFDEAFQRVARKFSRA